ncbi:uncharacterized protein LOC111872641 [Cryptotermes secundus]|uniref:uncharacterized protein LOC111872641 n=1 Tax=Cryptotermes secundus TaxID=105785 RepID=UPI000CD7ACCF|nr:uncharacterized protein LOC111872641 [Cryptotermes secundus]
MRSNMIARLSTPISRTLTLLSMAFTKHHRSQKQGQAAGEGEPLLQPVEEFPQEEPLQEYVRQTREETGENVRLGLTRSLDVLERRDHKRERVLLEAEEGTSSQLARGGDVGTSYPEVTEDSEEGEEEEVDMDYTIECPLFRIPEIKCFWLGSLRHLKEHVTGIHADIQKTSPWICCTSLTNSVLIICCYDDIFLYYKQFTDTGTMYAVVQQVGITNWNYTYTIQLFSHERESDNITFSFRMTKMREHLEDVLGDYECTVIDKHHLKPFIENGELAMSVNIRPVHKHKRTDVTETHDKKRYTSRTTPQRYKRELGEETVKCPLFKIPHIKCSWSGAPNILVLHLEAEHRKIVIRGPDFDCRLIVNKALLISFNDEIFLYYKYISSTIMYAIIQQVGMKNEKYTYIIELHSQDETVEDITFNLNVNPICEPFEALFDARECVAVAVEFLEQFIVNNELNMKVKIRSVRTQERMFVVAAGETKDDVASSPLEKDDQGTGIRTGKMRCPLFQIEEIKCPWLGNLENLEQHMANAHKNFVACRPYFASFNPTNAQVIVFFNDEIFLYHKYVSDTRILYAAVQQVGITGRRYQYTTYFYIPGETTAKVTLNFHTNKITESFEEIFKARRCLAVHIEFLAPFIQSNILFMKVKITEVPPSTQRNQ